MDGAILSELGSSDLAHVGFNPPVQAEDSEFLILPSGSETRLRREAQALLHMDSTDL